MSFIPRALTISPGERARFCTLALLLFANSMIVEANEVVATSGFVSRVGIEGIPWVWAIDMVVVILTSGAYSLVVDNTRRDRLGIRLFGAAMAIYLALYFLFRVGAPDWATYSLLTVLGDQQWMLFPMLIWALASDAFSMAEAKRLFPLLGAAAVVGGVAGNMVTAAVAGRAANPERGNPEMLLGAAALLAVMAVALAAASARWKVEAHQARPGEKVLDALREGMAFVREVPAFRYLATAMVLLGIGLNVVEYQLIATSSQLYTQASGMEGFYAMVRGTRILVMIVVQGALAGWLLRRLGLNNVFLVTPAALLVGLALAFLWPALIGVVLGEYVARITLEGIDEPSRRAFVGLVPDERRGRVGAFMDGYLYPLGSLLSCLLIGVAVAAVGSGLLTPELGRDLYFGVSLLCGVGGLAAILAFRASYESSMLNWRLKRRRRGSTLANLDL